MCFKINANFSWNNHTIQPKIILFHLAINNICITVFTAYLMRYHRGKAMSTFMSSE